MRIPNHYLIGAVAVGAAALTVHGSAHAAELAGVPAPWSYVYPVIGDLLAVAAWRATGAAERWRRLVARVTMVVAAAASGLAQGYALANGVNADGTPRPGPLAWGMGIAPAVVVLVVTVLGSVATAAIIPIKDDEQVEDEAPADPWSAYSVPVMSPAPAAAEATSDTDEATHDTADVVSPQATAEATSPGDTTPGGDIPAAAPGDTDEATPGDRSGDTGDTLPAEEPTPTGADPVEWLLAERLAGRAPSGAAVGRAFGRSDKAGERWGQRIVRAANDRAQADPPRIHAVR